ncbi:MAG: restriction endonuclease [Planctomycetaceae bacterium]|nr:restriction endonuclease [Planctomycetaceae bacterium]
MWTITVQHQGLGVSKTFKGRDKHLVEERANNQVQRWNDQWERRLAAQERRDTAEAKRQQRDAGLAEAAEETRIAQEAMAGWENILPDHVTGGIDLDWQPKKRHFREPAPKVLKPEPQPKTPIALEPKYIQSRRIMLLEKREFDAIGSAPRLDDYLEAANRGLGALFNTRKHSQRMHEAKVEFEEDIAKWKVARQELKMKIHAEVQHEIQDARRRHQAAMAAVRKQHEKVADSKNAYDAWKARRAEFERVEEERYENALSLRKQYEGGTASGVLRFIELLVEQAPGPEFMLRHVDAEYDEETRSIVMNSLLPAPSDVPEIREVKYIQTRQEFKETKHSDKTRRDIYDRALYQLVLKFIHDLYASDYAQQIRGVTINGVVSETNPATGKVEDNCILSLTTTPDQVLDIELTNVDPKACFRALKGVASSNLSALAPVVPIVRLAKDDKRFIKGEAIGERLDDTPNIATMDWEDFEHLVRELFEREFSANGSEVKITRASRDAGVDAVVFDPDPIRGGKIVIQAKRYTHTVDVSAVRDLYGTVVNEGANTGILVTTSEYGPDAYNFAKDKPLKLLTGGNLLSLLGKHGYMVRLDIKEAKRLLKEDGSKAGRFSSVQKRIGPK